MSLKANNNTALKTEIKCNQRIDFTKVGTTASLLGFESTFLDPGIKHDSDKSLNIMKVDVVRVACNIVRGSYENGREGHDIHDFSPNVGPGYKIVEIPNTIIYLPVNVKRINNVTICLKTRTVRELTLEMKGSLSDCI